MVRVIELCSHACITIATCIAIAHKFSCMIGHLIIHYRYACTHRADSCSIPGPPRHGGLNDFGKVIMHL